MIIPAIENISLEGFQVVTRAIFDTEAMPILTIWENYIGFSNASYAALENCERVRIMLHESKKLVVLIPTTESDNESIQWRKTEKVCAFKKIACKQFSTKLMTAWGLETTQRHRCYGRVARADNKVVLLFDFNNAIPMSGKTKGV